MRLRDHMRCRPAVERDRHGAVREPHQAVLANIAMCYDKAGKLWKFLAYTMSPYKTHDGFWSFIPYEGFCADFKQMHSSIFYSVGCKNDPPEIKENDVNLDEL